MDDTIAGLIRMLGLRMHLRADRAVAASGLTAQQGRVLGFIGAHQGDGVIQKDVAAASGTSPANVTSLLQGLERGGYIERRVSPADERRKTLHVLPKGQAVIDGFHRTLGELDAELLASLSPAEQQTLRDLLARVYRDIDWPDAVPSGHPPARPRPEGAD